MSLKQGFRVLTLAIALAGVVGPLSASAAAVNGLVIDYEAGPLSIVQNDNRYGANGTPYNRSDVGLDRNLAIAMRTSLEADIDGRNTLIFLYAPLDVTTDIRLNKNIQFNDVLFNAGTPIRHRYLFDGIRASYMYGIFKEKQWRWDLGLTGQIRNAQVAMSTLQGTSYASESDIGFVPALKTRFTYHPSRGFWGMWEADALNAFGAGGVSGWIADTALTLGVPLRQGIDAHVRARYVGGGANVPNRQIENWGQFVSLTAGFRFNMTKLSAWPFPFGD
jgi:hypothetical protein